MGREDIQVACFLEILKQQYCTRWVSNWAYHQPASQSISNRDNADLTERWTSSVQLFVMCIIIPIWLFNIAMDNPV